jgi:type I protein arginine methyltransferase
MASLLSVEDEDDQQGWEEAMDGSVGEEKAPTRGLFTDELFDTPEDALKRATADSNFDLLKLIQDVGGDFYTSIKIVNYVRSKAMGGETPSAVEAELRTNSQTILSDDQFLASTVTDDPLLIFVSSIAGFDDDSDEDEGAGSEHDDSDDDMPAPSSAVGGQTSQPRGLKSAGELEQENVELKAMLARCRKMLNSMVMSDEGGAVSSEEEKDKPQDNDSYYFDSYSYTGIHETMLKDTARTIAYRDAIYKNPHLFKDKVVLDVGCGTGILSMFAARAGAKHVIGVDMSEMAYKAMEIVRSNNLENTITIVHGKVENIKLPSGSDKVDLIVSEWMGYALVYECMLETVLHARDQWLKPGGVMFPNVAKVFLGGLSDEALWKDKVGYWGDVYGFDMSCMQKKDSTKEADVFVVEDSSVSTSMAPVWTLDIQTITPSQLDRETRFELMVRKDGPLTGFVITFDCAFNEKCEHEVVLKTGTDTQPTHWKQTVLHLKTPSQALNVGDVVAGKFTIKRNDKNPRYLDMELVVDAGKAFGESGLSETYTLE